MVGKRDQIFYVTSICIFVLLCLCGPIIDLMDFLPCFPFQSNYNLITKAKVLAIYVMVLVWSLLSSLKLVLSLYILVWVSVKIFSFRFLFCFLYNQLFLIPCNITESKLCLLHACSRWVLFFCVLLVFFFISSTGSSNSLPSVSLHVSLCLILWDRGRQWCLSFPSLFSDEAYACVQ